MNKLHLTISLAAIFVLTAIVQLNWITKQVYADVPATPPVTAPITTPAPTQTVANQPSNSNNNSQTEVKAYSCNNEKPKTAPVLLSATWTGKNSVTLKWTKVEPVTKYAVTYGTASGVEQYGDVNISDTVTSYTVNGLTQGTVYYFKVRGINDCAAGDASKEISTKRGVVTAVVSTVKTTGKTQAIAAPKTISKAAQVNALTAKLQVARLKVAEAILEMNSYN